MKVDLNGRVALVTGAGRNIGQAIAEKLSANGATVVFTDLAQSDAQAAAEGVPNAIGLALDVTDENAATRVLTEVKNRFGRLDILVNNAGINTRVRVPVDEFPREEWDNILSVDLTGLYFLCREAAKIMRKQQSGRIINISSVVGMMPLRLQCAFAAAKAGVIQLTKAMALELGHAGIQVNAIAPGSIRTEGTKYFWGDPTKSQSMVSHIPLGRPGEVGEIAHATLFLAAPESGYITGHCLTVDGGWTVGFMRDF